jgi:1-acyl-sn-glycerol-3-phosphate acyltransferase
VLRVPVIILLLILNTALWGTLIFLGGIVKLLSFGKARHQVILGLAWLGARWVQGSNQIFDWFLDTEWRLEGFDGFRRDGHYLVVSNHVSWIDIFCAFRALHGKAPFIRFFLKHTLKWFPIVGQACWALEFPFMRRYSPEYLAQHPEKRGRDLETTRRACQRYRHLPVTILNFAEGTRFTREKQQLLKSPYRHLLPPRGGGIGFVIASLGEQLDSLIDMTIVFPTPDLTIWDFVNNRVPWIAMSARRVHIPNELITPAITEPGPEREAFKAWIGKIWQDKDREIERILLESRT